MILKTDSYICMILRILWKQIEKYNKMELSAKYDPSQVEDKWYAYWLKNKFFHSEPDEREPYTIVIPPPNVTGILHMGHVLNNTLNDVLIRKARMDGKNACWVPGTDHASIATESKVVARLKSQGINKEDLTREEFLKYAWEWKEEHGGIILNQLRKLGASCDWDRTKFTMDPDLTESVINTFVYFYKKGLIYRGVRMVNWDPEGHTAVSDEEVIHKETKSHFYHLRYYISDGNGKRTDKYIVVATTRPETIMADAAVSINPDDERYHWLKGKKVLIPLIDKEIPIIEDSYVEIGFGTGCLKVTPAHDINDYEIGLRHNLPVTDIIDDHGKLNEKAQILVGEDRFVARKKIEKMLAEAGCLEKVEEYISPIGYSERTNAVIEPRLSTQWFLKMGELAEMALNSVESGNVKLIPDKYRNTYKHWMETVRDWCISRQLWWGHRIPAYYCDECGEVVVAKKMPEVCPKCGCTHFTQDPDTLDTWFSSALWPFSTLGWPEQTEDLKYFYPTDVLVTGYDIIFFWVIRMIFSGYEQMGERPFKTVLFHGLVRDSQGRKMSKSLGNGIDPLEIIDQYGADALRLTLITGNAPGNDMRFYYEKVEANRNFANKVWNASRFIMMNMEGKEITVPAASELEPVDKWILSKCNTLVKDVTENMENYDLGIAVQKVYDFIWDEFCDWYIEMVKPRLYNSDDARSQNAALYTLKSVLIDALKLLHPYMPFITEEIFCTLQSEEESIMISRWPEYSEDKNYPKEEKDIEIIKEAVRGIRNIRTEMNVAPSKKATVYVVSEDEGIRRTFEEGKLFFATLSYASEVLVQKDKTGIADDAVSVMIAGAALYIPFAELVDIQAEIERLEKEEKRLAGEIARCEGMLKNEKFISKAPEAKVAEEKEKLAKYTNLAEQVKARLAQLKAM